MLLIVGTGEISEADTKAQMGEAVRLLKQHQVPAVLVDYSEALAEVSLSGAYGLPDYYASLGGPWRVRAAIVTPRSRYRMETYQFLELVCKNVGYDVRLFETREAAEAWLAQAVPVPARLEHSLT